MASQRKLPHCCGTVPGAINNVCWPLQIVQEPNSKAQHVVLHAGARTQEDGSSSDDEEPEEPAERHAECSFARDFRTCVESAGGECSSGGQAGCSLPRSRESALTAKKRPP